MSVYKIVVKYLWDVAIGISAAATLIILHVFDIHPEQALAFAVLGVIADPKIADPKILEALQWGSVVVAALSAAGITHFMGWHLSRRGQGAQLLKHDACDVSPKRDVWLMDAIKFIVIGEWSDDELSTVDQGDDMKRAMDKIQQAALDKKLPIWGIRLEGHLQELIEPDEWKTLQIDWWGALEGETENLGLKHGSAISNDFPAYMSPMTSRASVEGLWGNNNITR